MATNCGQGKCCVSTLLCVCTAASLDNKFKSSSLDGLFHVHAVKTKATAQLPACQALGLSNFVITHAVMDISMMQISQTLGTPP